MDFTFTDEQRMMAAALRELTDDLCSGSRLRAAFDGVEDLSRTRWDRVVEMGLPGMLAPEKWGGLGLTASDFVLIAEEAGRAAWPDPLVEHAGVVVPLLAECAEAANTRTEVLQDAVRGAARVAVSHPSNPLVDNADRASYVVVCRPDEIHVVEVATARLTPKPSIDALRRLFCIETDLGPATLVARGQFARDASARAARRAAVFVAAQGLGLAERMISLAVEYATGRHQFGRAIGSYQAIKHHLATAQVKLDFARPAVYYAAARLGDSGARARVAAAHAKIVAMDAADLAARTAIQVHGAMGYSWEVDLHFYMKRAWALAGTWGDRNVHVRQVHAALLSGELSLGPDGTFAM